ncbi:MAG: hypothetical protein HUU15_08270 [Candidatus Brocadiae bacterium]|nr:hypothetical protein [Candidatus Brocadiia bacterium]
MRPCTTIASVLLLALAARADDAPDDKSSLALAERIEEAVNTGGDEMDAVMDVSGMVDRAMQGPDVGADVKKGFRSGVLSTSLGSQLAGAVAEGARYTFLRRRVKDGKATLLFRLLLPSGSVNYHEYMIAKDGDGAKVDDLYIYLTGETFVRTIRREFLKTVAITSKAPANLQGWEKDLFDNLDKLGEMTAALRGGKFKQVLKLYGELPESVRNEKSTMMIRLSAAQQVGEKEYNRVLADWEKAFPGDASLDLMQIDLFFNQQKFDEVVQVLGRLSTRLDGDAFCDYLAGSVRLQQEKYQEARIFADKSVEAEPGLREGYFLLLAVSLPQKDHEATVKALVTLETEFGVPVGDLSAEPGYEDFVKSAEYTAWLESRGGDK